MGGVGKGEDEAEDEGDFEVERGRLVCSRDDLGVAEEGGRENRGDGEPGSGGPRCVEEEVSTAKRGPLFRGAEVELCFGAHDRVGVAVKGERKRVWIRDPQRFCRLPPLGGLSDTTPQRRPFRQRRGGSVERAGMRPFAKGADVDKHVPLQRRDKRKPIPFPCIPPHNRPALPPPVLVFRLPVAVTVIPLSLLPVSLHHPPNSKIVSGVSMSMSMSLTP